MYFGQVRATELTLNRSERPRYAAFFSLLQVITLPALSEFYASPQKMNTLCQAAIEIGADEVSVLPVKSLTELLHKGATGNVPSATQPGVAQIQWQSLTGKPREDAEKTRCCVVSLCRQYSTHILYCETFHDMPIVVRELRDSQTRGLALSQIFCAHYVHASPREETIQRIPRKSPGI